MTYSAAYVNTNALANPVRQVAHGFIAGDVVRFNGTDYVYADNSAAVNSQNVGIIYAISDADHFWVTQVGFVYALATVPSEGGVYVPGNLYYLSDNPGLMTAVKPSAPGEIVAPLFVAVTSTSGYFKADFGRPTPQTLEVVAVNTAMVPFVRYATNSGALITMALPATAEVGDIFYVESIDVGGFRVSQPANVTGILSTFNTTVGVAGYLEGAGEGRNVAMEVVSSGVGYEYIVYLWNGPITVA